MEAPMQTPLTVAHRDYVNQIVNLTNSAPLPSFLKIDVLEKVIQQLRPLVEQEYQRDKAAYDEAAKETADADT